MTDKNRAFWDAFNQQQFDLAETELTQSSSEERQNILAELYQKSSFHHMPFSVSILRRKPHENQSFDDFYQAWFPPKATCNEIESRGQVFQQHFPAPVRVINGTNIDNSGEIISIGITWLRNKEEEQLFWDYLEQTMAGENKGNEERRENIEEVADGELIGLYQIRSDDNLGIPY